MSLHRADCTTTFMLSQVWDAVSGEEELNLQHKHIVKSVNFSDDSVNLATGSNDKIIRIFDLEKSNDGPKV
jgi:serine-threonine kinase receptor-associated protein